MSIIAASPPPYIRARNYLAPRCEREREREREREKRAAGLTFDSYEGEEVVLFTREERGVQVADDFRAVLLSLARW